MLPLDVLWLSFSDKTKYWLNMPYACNSYAVMCQRKEVKESESISVMSDSLKPTSMI